MYYSNLSDICVRVFIVCKEIDRGVLLPNVTLPRPPWRGLSRQTARVVAPCHLYQVVTGSTGYGYLTCTPYLKVLPAQHWQKKDVKAAAEGTQLL